jgi:hypothetical protein
MAEQCRFGCGTAIVKVELSAGCVCWPNDHEQYLCAQHAYKIEPLGAGIIAWHDLIDGTVTRYDRA